MTAAAANRVDQTGWLVAHGLAKRFGSKTVVHDVSIAVRRGEAVGLLGPNGAGKTTVFTIIMGLLKPDKGEVRLDGIPITRLPLFQRGRLGIGYLPQEPSIFRGLTVMLLDEPFAGVDPIAVADVKGLVRQLTRRGIGVLITDHSVRETLSLVDRAYLIHDGRVMIQGKPEIIAADPEARRVYLGESFSV